MLDLTRFSLVALVIVQRFWAQTHPAEYLNEVLKKNFEISKSPHNAILREPLNANELAKLVVLAEHPQAGPRLKSMVEKLQKIYLEED